jgi:hypothetical protein
MQIYMYVPSFHERTSLFRKKWRWPYHSARIMDHNSAWKKLFSCLSILSRACNYYFVYYSTISTQTIKSGSCPQDRARETRVLGSLEGLARGPSNGLWRTSTKCPEAATTVQSKHQFGKIGPNNVKCHCIHQFEKKPEAFPVRRWHVQYFAIISTFATFSLPLFFRNFSATFRDRVIQNVRRCRPNDTHWD